MFVCVFLTILKPLFSIRNLILKKQTEKLDAFNYPDINYFV